MTANLTVGALLMLSNQEPETMYLRSKPVVQVTDIWTVRRHTPAILTFTNAAESNDRYHLMLSDASYCHLGRLDPKLNNLITSHKLRKGSIVRLTGFVCSWFSDRSWSIVIQDVTVIVDKCDIIGDPKPMTCLFHVHADSDLSGDVDDSHHVQENRDSTKEYSCLFQSNPTKNHKRESSNNPKNTAIMRMKKITKEDDEYDDDDVGACIAKLEELGWGAEDPLYDTAVLMFGESGVYRKLWLHLKPESCGKWVRNAGSKYGLLG